MTMNALKMYKMLDFHVIPDLNMFHSIISVIDGEEASRWTYGQEAKYFRVLHAKPLLPSSDNLH